MNIVKIPVDFVTVDELFTSAVNPRLIEHIINLITPAKKFINEKRNLLPKGFQVIFKLGDYIMFYGEQAGTPILTFIHKSNSIENVVDYLKANNLSFLISDLEVYEGLKLALEDSCKNPDTKNQIVWDYSK